MVHNNRCGSPEHDMECTQRFPRAYLRTISLHRFTFPCIPCPIISCHCIFTHYTFLIETSRTGFFSQQLLKFPLDAEFLLVASPRIHIVRPLTAYFLLSAFPLEASSFVAFLLIIPSLVASPVITFALIDSPRSASLHPERLLFLFRRYLCTVGANK